MSWGRSSAAGACCFGFSGCSFRSKHRRFAPTPDRRVLPNTETLLCPSPTRLPRDFSSSFFPSSAIHSSLFCWQGCHRLFVFQSSSRATLSLAFSAAQLCGTESHFQLRIAHTSSQSVAGWLASVKSNLNWLQIVAAAAADQERFSAKNRSKRSIDREVSENESEREWFTRSNQTSGARACCRLAAKHTHTNSTEMKLLRRLALQVCVNVSAGKTINRK